MSSLHIFVSATLLLSAVKGLSRLYTTDFLTPFYNSLFIYYSCKPIGVSSPNVDINNVVITSNMSEMS